MEYINIYHGPAATNNLDIFSGNNPPFEQNILCVFGEKWNFISNVLQVFIKCGELILKNSIYFLIDPETNHGKRKSAMSRYRYRCGHCDKNLMMLSEIFPPQE